MVNNMDKLPKVCFVGTGRHAREKLYPALRTTPIILVGICARHIENAKLAANLFSRANVYTDFREMIEKEKPDGVLVCGPPELHMDVAIFALEKGCFVFVEKPPAPTCAEAEKLATLAEKRQKMIQVGLQNRFAPAFLKLKDFINGKQIGNLRIFEAKLAVGQLAPDNDLLSYVGIHILDLVAFLFGNIISVFVRHYKSVNKWNEAYSINCRCSSGAIGSITINDMQSFNAFGQRLEVTGDNGFAIVDRGVKLTYYSGYPKILGVSTETVKQPQPAQVWEPNYGIDGNSLEYNGFNGEMRAFAQTLIHGIPPSTAIQNLLPTMKLIEEIERQGPEVLIKL